MGTAIDRSRAYCLTAMPTRSIGGAGLAVGLAVLQKTHSYDHVIHLTPQVWDNSTPDGVSKLQSAYDSTLDPYYSVAYDVKPYTTYTKQDLIKCAGPG